MKKTSSSVNESAEAAASSSASPYHLCHSYSDHFFSDPFLVGSNRSGLRYSAAWSGEEISRPPPPRATGQSVLR